MVRNSDKGAKVAARFPKIRLVYGTLDSTELITTEASSADIVLNCADCDHVACAEALIAGLARSGRKSYLIHVSGAAIVSLPDYVENTYGISREKVYDDWDNLTEVTVSLPDTAFHRNVDKIILGANEASAGNIQSAIVCPPTIYGPGRGPDNNRSIQVYDMVKATLERMKGFIVGEGLNRWNEVHVQDLSELFLALVTAALSPDGGKASWNKEGYYFAENGEFAWGDVGRKIGEFAFKNKLINHEGVDHLTKEEADTLRPFGSVLWGTNSRCTAIRAKKLLGWTPKQKSLFDLLPEIVNDEAKSLGRILQHAQEAAEGRILK